MTRFAAVLARIPGLDAGTLELWVEQQWVRPLHVEGEAVFQDIDIARLRLIVELRDQLEVAEPALPVVLSLLDQLHESRRQMRRLCQALDAAGPDETVQSILGRLLGS